MQQFAVSFSYFRELTTTVETMWYLLQKSAFLPPTNGQDVQDYAADDSADRRLPKLEQVRAVIELDADVHAEQADDDHAGGEHDGRGGEHDPHLEKLVLLLVEHYVDVIFGVVHVLPQLH